MSQEYYKFWIKGKGRERSGKASNPLLQICKKERNIKHNLSIVEWVAMNVVIEITDNHL
jgi:hypothetical protein